MKIKYILGLVAFVLVQPVFGQTFNQWTGNFDNRINNSTFSAHAKLWLKSLVVGPNNGDVSPGVPLLDPGSMPTPCPTPIPPPPPPGVPLQAPSVVTNCPNQRFLDNFQETNFTQYLSLWGPITAPVKWITNKPDGLTYGGYMQPPSDTATYFTGGGFLTLQIHNYFQNSQYPKGDGNWFGGTIASLAWKNQIGGGPPTGFKVAPPLYFEAAVWIPPLTACDVPNAAGLWPSIGLYTDPSLTAGAGKSGEIDLFEIYSIDYTKIHLSSKSWTAAGALTSIGGTTLTVPDISRGWHVYGLWVDVATTHWYLDGMEVLNCPTVFGVPWYFILTNGYGGGWHTSMTPSELYPYKIAYVVCFAP